jgi:hypothetical protein
LPVLLDTVVGVTEHAVVFNPSPIAMQELSCLLRPVLPTRRAPIRRVCAAIAWALAMAAPAGAHRGASEASEFSLLPVAVSVAAPLGLLSAGAVFTVVAVDALSTGTVWVLERASDGTRASVVLGAHAAAGVSVLAGTAVVATALSTGWVLSVAGQAVAFVPNASGQALLYNERVTP